MGTLFQREGELSFHGLLADTVFHLHADHIYTGLSVFQQGDTHAGCHVAFGIKRGVLVDRRIGLRPHDFPRGRNQRSYITYVDLVLISQLVTYDIELRPHGVAGTIGRLFEWLNVVFTAEVLEVAHHQRVARIHGVAADLERDRQLGGSLGDQILDLHHDLVGARRAQRRRRYFGFDLRL